MKTDNTEKKQIVKEKFRSSERRDTVRLDTGRMKCRGQSGSVDHQAKKPCVQDLRER